MKHRTHRILSLLLAIVLVVSIIPPVNASAAQGVDYYGRNILAQMSNADALLFAYDQILQGILDSESSISVYDGISSISGTEIRTVMDMLQMDHTGLFWYKGYSFSQSGGGVLSVSPKYTMSGSNLETAKSTFYAAADEILDGISASMSEYERELYIHDRLAARVTYTSTSNAHNAYGALVEGNAVCDGYSKAFQYLLQQAGIQSLIVTGYSENPSTGTMEGHAWNIVRINGKHYHVDVTWDDQGKNLYHAYFNLTDARIQEDHVIESTNIPACNSEDAFYFHNKPTYLDTYTTDSVGKLLKDNGLRVNVYVPGDVDAFGDWFFDNAWPIGNAAGIHSGFSCGYSRLGRELILHFTVSGCSHSNLTKVAGFEPTCTADGQTTYYTCTCGKWFQDAGATTEITNRNSVIINRLGHNWNAGTVTKAPTELEPGIRTYTCTRCGETKTEEIPAAEHTHSYEDVVTPPTCTEEGFTTHTCICGDSYTDSYTDPLGHNMGAWSVDSAATCTAKGSERRDCTRCDHYETRAVDKIPHSYTAVVKDPTCEAGGYTTHTCACGDSYTDSYTDSLGHIWDGGVVTTEPTEDADGVRTYTCTRCGITKSEPIPKLSHVHQYKDYVTEPTCTEKGYTYHSCTCGDNYTDSYTDPLGHDWDHPISVYKTCIRCGDSNVPDHIIGYGECGDNLTWTLDDQGKLTVSGTGPMDDFYDAFQPWVYKTHNIISIVIEPGVTHIGEKAFLTCKKVTSVSIPDTVVSIGNYAFAQCEKLPKLEVPGSVKSIGQCAFAYCYKLADLTLSEGIETIAPGGFYESYSLKTVTVPSTVSSLGYGAFGSTTAHPSQIQDIYILNPACTIGEDDELVALGNPAKTVVHSHRDDYAHQYAKKHGYTWEEMDHKHDYTAVVTDPTCTVEGYTTYTCNCGHSYVDSYTDPLGHDWDDGVITTQPTENDTGVRTHTCSRCGMTKEEDIPKLDHVHSYTAVVTDPTCTEKGFTTHTCACGHSYTDSEVPALGHAWDYPDAEYRTCSRCGTTTVPGNIIDYGICGDNLTWNLDNQGKLTISGTGTMYDYGDPLGTYDDRTLSPWNEYTTNNDNVITTIVIGSGVTHIGDKAFNNCDYMVSVSIPATVKSIGHSAFSMCVSIPGIVIPDSVETIGEYAFFGCYELTSVTIPLSVRSIGVGAFRSPLYRDSDLEDIYILNPDCTIGDDDELGETLGAPALTVVHSPRGSLAEAYANKYGYTWEELDHEHNYTAVVTDPTCTEQGFTTHTCDCGDNYVGSYTDPLGHDWDNPAAGFKTCRRCGATEGTPPLDDGYRITLNIADVGETKSVWIDGVEYPVIADGDRYHVDLQTTTATNLVVYQLHNADAEDIHTQYPDGMKVWILKFDGTGYTATYIPEFDNLLGYEGSSIRITGVKGIRMITSIAKTTKNALTGKGLAGYTLVEYGTALAWASDVTNGLVLGQEYTKSNFAYKKGVADPIFATTKTHIQYTNVLVGFNNDQCIPDIAMRPYIILADADGNQVTIYGGIVYRNIGYIAYQNRNAFKPGSGSYAYIWDIIHHVYGDKFDADYKG